MGLFDLFRKKKVPLTEEQLKWNNIWDLWVEGKAASPYAQLMTYQSEVNNGGHDQYFTNVENIGDIKKELSALADVLSPALNDNLQKAYQAYLELEENKDGSPQAEDILERCDDVFYENESEINGALEDYAATIKL